MKSYIYVIENTVNGMAYVGKANNVNRRWLKHIEAARTSDGFLYRAIRKYGRESFVVHTVDESDDESHALRVLEPEWISYMRMMGVSLYNLAEGGHGSTGHRHTAETRVKMSETRRGWVPSEEVRAKISDALRGLQMSDETRMKISESHRGKKKPPRSAEHCAKISASKKGKKITDEHAERIRQSMISSPNVGHPIDSETRAKIAEKLRNQKQSPETRAKRAESMRLAWERRRAAKADGTP